MNARLAEQTVCSADLPNLPETSLLLFCVQTKDREHCPPWSAGPPRAECPSLFLCSALWMLSPSSSARNAAHSHTPQTWPGIKKNTIDRECILLQRFRYLVKEQMALKVGNKATGQVVACVFVWWILTGLIWLFYHPPDVLPDGAVRGAGRVPSVFSMQPEWAGALKATIITTQLLWCHLFFLFFLCTNRAPKNEIRS